MDKSISLRVSELDRFGTRRADEPGVRIYGSGEAIWPDGVMAWKASRSPWLAPEPQVLRLRSAHVPNFAQDDSLVGVGEEQATAKPMRGFFALLRMTTNLRDIEHNQERAPRRGAAEAKGAKVGLGLVVVVVVVYGLAGEWLQEQRAVQVVKVEHAVQLAGDGVRRAVANAAELPSLMKRMMETGRSRDDRRFGLE